MQRNSLLLARRALLGTMLAAGAVGAGTALAQNRVEAQSIIVVGQTWVDAADLNNNGVVSYNEFRRQAFLWFIDVDTDLDDVVDAREYEAALRQQGLPAKTIQSARKAFFATTDRDRDGNIGYYELSSTARARFTALDRDRDRQLGPNELRAVSAGTFDVALIPPQQ